MALIFQRRSRRSSRKAKRVRPFTARGRRIALSPPRRFMTDLLHFSQKLPSVPMQRRMRLADVAEARGKWPQRVSWCSIFLKAYSIVASRTPELRPRIVPLPLGTHVRAPDEHRHVQR